MQSDLRLEPFDPAGATEQEWRALNTYQNRLRAYFRPDDRPIPINLTREQWSGLLPVILDPQGWLVWDADRNAIIAMASAGAPPSGGQQEADVADFMINVLPEWRRHGIGTALLRYLSSHYHKPVQLYTTRSDSSDPGGDAFMTRVGGKLALALIENVLDLATVDHTMLEAWYRKYQEQLTGYELGVWSEGFVAEEYPAIAKLFNAWDRDMPREQLQRDPMNVVPEMMGAMQARMEAAGMRSSAVYVRERESGEIIGFCFTSWNIHQPETGELVGIEVLAPHRGLGLGRWLTVAQLLDLLHNHSEMKQLETHNAQSNTAILKINRDIGFKAVRMRNRWEVLPEHIKAYLSNRSEAFGE